VFYETATQAKLLEIQKSLFPVTGLFNFTNMTYPGGLWSFTWASRGLHPLNDLRPDRAPAPMFYYSPEVHRSAFQLPRFQREALAPWITV
jgi:spermidine synthase